MNRSELQDFVINLLDEANKEISIDSSTSNSDKLIYKNLNKDLYWKILRNELTKNISDKFQLASLFTEAEFIFRKRNKSRLFPTWTYIKRKIDYQWKNKEKYFREINAFLKTLKLENILAEDFDNLILEPLDTETFLLFAERDNKYILLKNYYLNNKYYFTKPIDILAKGLFRTMSLYNAKRVSRYILTTIIVILASLFLVHRIPWYIILLSVLIILIGFGF